MYAEEPVGAPPDQVGVETFAEHRDVLFAIAYRMLGSVTDAQDAVQDAWLRWAAVDHTTVRHPRAYLIRTISRLSLDRLRSATSRREVYVGPWLPEPLDTGPDVAEEVAQADSVSMALLVVLETLSPLERAVFVLREAFELPYGEIAEALGSTETAVRQLAHRARAHVAARRPRYESDPIVHRTVSERFLAACASGQLSELVDVLAPDVTLVADSGGVTPAPPKPLAGALTVARFLLYGIRASPDDVRIEPRRLNAGPGLVAFSRGAPLATLVLDSAGGRIAAIYLVSNPGKLSSVALAPGDAGGGLSA
ncbi:MAG TPA: RNA polymerase sigma-70 factor [Mycobacteriales bacterium]|nr:RNA polymerase sigma-70 factor [Mycobacteriales bacterium]